MPKPRCSSARVSRFLALSLVGFLGCSDDSTSPTGIPESKFVIAAEGDTIVHPSGATLYIPAGALSQDATVTITDEGYTGIHSKDPMLPVSQRFVIDLGAADAVSPLTLAITYADVDSGGGSSSVPNVLVAGWDPESTPILRPGVLDIANHAIRVSLQRELNEPNQEAHTFEAQFVPGVTFPTVPPILPVPYYSQDNLPWCVPTSTAMVLDFFNVGTRYANFQLAGLDTQDTNSGNSYNSVLDAINIPKSKRTYLKWDADLIPGAPFVAYVNLMTHGYNLQDILGPVILVNGKGIAVPDVDVPPRTLGLSSTTTTHAFVAAGSNNSTIWVHDPSGAFAGVAGIAEEMTWLEFKAVAMDATSATELRSLLLDYPVRPANERLGSIVLQEGTDGSLTYRASPGGTILSYWQWDGDPYLYGYYWDDPTVSLPDDTQYGNLFPVGPTGGLPGVFEYKTWIGNVTSIPRTYSLNVQMTTFGTTHDTETQEIVVPPYTWKTATLTGTLDDQAAPMASGATVTIRFELRESGVIQDSKVALFKTTTAPVGGGGAATSSNQPGATESP